MLLGYSSVQEAIGSLGFVFGELHQLIKEEQDFYNGNFGTRLGQFPSKLKNTYIPPTHRFVIDDAVAHLSPNRPLVSVQQQRARGNQNEANLQEEQELVTTFWTHFWEKQATRPVVAPLQPAYKYLLLNGLGVLKLLYQSDARKPYPKRLRGERKTVFERRMAEWQDDNEEVLPFNVRAVNPYNIFWDVWSEEPQWVIERQRQWGQRVRLEYPLWQDPKHKLKKKSAEATEIVTFWSKDQFGMWADGEDLLQYQKGVKVYDDGLADNPYGVIPYSIGLSGAGLEDYEGRIKFQAVGAMRFIMDALALEARQWTQRDFMREQSAWGLKLVQFPEEAGGEAAAQDWIGRYNAGLTGFQSFPAGAQLIPVFESEIPAAWLQEAESTRKDIERMGWAQVFPLPRGESGASRYMYIQEGLIKLEESVQTLQRMVSDMNRITMACWQHNDLGPVTIYAQRPGKGREPITIDIETLQKYPETIVKLKNLSEDEIARAQQRFTQLYQIGIVPKAEVAKHSDLVNPTELMRERLVEDVMYNPALTEAVVQYLSQRIGLALQQRLKAMQPQGPAEPIAPAVTGPTPPAMPGTVQEQAMQQRRDGRTLPPVGQRIMQ